MYVNNTSIDTLLYLTLFTKSFDMHPCITSVPNLFRPNVIHQKTARFKHSTNKKFRICDYKFDKTNCILYNV